MLHQDNYFAVSVKLNFWYRRTRIDDRDRESDSYDKNDMKENVNSLVRLHKAIQGKLKTASHSEQIQILTLVPDKWSRMHCSEYFNVFNTLFERHMKSNKSMEY